MAKDYSKSFYDSREWMQVRSAVLMRDRYTCRICGRPAEEVHHVIHLTPANIWDTSVTLNPDNLISLCHSCHMAEHADDRADGRPHRYGRNTLPKVAFDAAGNPVVVPRMEEG